MSRFPFVFSTLYVCLRIVGFPAEVVKNECLIPNKHETTVVLLSCYCSVWFTFLKKKPTELHIHVHALLTCQTVHENRNNILLDCIFSYIVSLMAFFKPSSLSLVKFLLRSWHLMLQMVLQDCSDL